LVKEGVLCIEVDVVAGHKNKPSQKAQTSLRALAVPQTYKAAMSTSMPKILPTQPATSLLTT
jgi:hypothetical protein